MFRVAWCDPRNDHCCLTYDLYATIYPVIKQQVIINYNNQQWLDWELSKRCLASRNSSQWMTSHTQVNTSKQESELFTWSNTVAIRLFQVWISLQMRDFSSRSINESCSTIAASIFTMIGGSFCFYNQQTLFFVVLKTLISDWIECMAIELASFQIFNKFEADFIFCITRT